VEKGGSGSVRIPNGSGFSSERTKSIKSAPLKKKKLELCHFFKKRCKSHCFTTKKKDMDPIKILIDPDLTPVGPKIPNLDSAPDPTIKLNSVKSHVHVINFL